MSLEPLTLVTITHDRPVAFSLCREMIERQGMPNGSQWLVVSDGRDDIDVSPHAWAYINLPFEGNPAKSFRGNLLAALATIEATPSMPDRILFIEDDDWYSPDYFEFMSTLFDSRASLIGSARAKYYNIATRRYRQLRNSRHASLCQTGVTRELVPWMIRQIKQTQTTSIDLHTWRHAKCARRLTPHSQHCIGIKGMPGTKGIGIGHRFGANQRHDADGSKLAEWVGEEDAAKYLELSCTRTLIT